MDDSQRRYGETLQCVAVADGDKDAAKNDFENSSNSGKKKKN